MRERRPFLCPHCSEPLQPIRFGVPFGPIAVRIIDTVAAANAKGVARHDLLVAAYGHNDAKAERRLRSYVSAINRALTGSAVAIRAERGAYRLASRRRAWTDR